MATSAEYTTKLNEFISNFLSEHVYGYSAVAFNDDGLPYMGVRYFIYPKLSPYRMFADQFVYNPYTGEKISIAVPSGKINAPLSWNEHYVKGLLPFRSQCPVCKAQTILNVKPYEDTYTSLIVEDVQCIRPSHYRWTACNNKHETLASSCIESLERKKIRNEIVLIQQRLVNLCAQLE